MLFSVIFYLSFLFGQQKRQLLQLPYYSAFINYVRTYGKMIVEPCLSRENKKAVMKTASLFNLYLMPLLAYGARHFRIRIRVVSETINQFAKEIYHYTHLLCIFSIGCPSKYGQALHIPSESI